MELCLSDHFSSYLLCPRRRIPIGVVLSKNTFQKTLAIFTKMFANLSHDVCLYPVIGHHITICKPQWLQPKEQSGALHPISSLDLSLWLLFLWSLWHIAWPGLSLGQWVVWLNVSRIPNDAQMDNRNHFRTQAHKCWQTSVGTVHKNKTYSCVSLFQLLESIRY